MSHRNVYSPKNYAILHIPGMNPHELVDALVKRTGLPLLEVATQMDKASFQPTLHKFVNGLVSNPSRKTAKKIADYFELPTDAMYDKALATRIAHERGLHVQKGGVKPVELKAQERSARYTSGGLHKSILARIDALTSKQLKGLEQLIKTYLEAIEPEADHSKARDG
jgi:DNA-binding XRE family transcriptional regulator